MPTLLTSMFSNIPRPTHQESEFSFPMLFRDIDDRQHSTLAYETNFFPTFLMKPKHKVAWQRHEVFTKSELLNSCNPEFTELFLPDSPASFPIFWIYNAIPTKIEWDKLQCSTRLRVDFRISPLIPGGGRAAIISFA